MNCIIAKFISPLGCVDKCVNLVVAYSFMYLVRIEKVPNFVTFLNLPRICVCLTVIFNRPAYVVPLLSSATGTRTKSRCRYLWNLWNTNNLQANLTCFAAKESGTSKTLAVCPHISFYLRDSIFSYCHFDHTFFHILFLYHIALHFPVYVFCFFCIATLDLIALNCFASPERRTLHRLTLPHSCNISQTQPLHPRAFPADDATRVISQPSLFSPEYSSCGA